MHINSWPRQLAIKVNVCELSRGEDDCAECVGWRVLRAVGTRRVVMVRGEREG